MPEREGYVLAVDTSTEVIAVGVGVRGASGGLGEVLSTIDAFAPRAAMSYLLPQVEDALREAGLKPSDIEEVAVGRGPGSFTGVRIGVASAKGMARGLGVPLRGIGTLDAVARRAEVSDGIVGVIGDAMRGEIYPVLYRCEGGIVRRLTPYEVRKPLEVAQAWARDIHEEVVLCGNGLVRYSEVMTEALGSRARLADSAQWYPSGRSLLDCVWADTASASEEPSVILPVYTRLSDAEEAERARPTCGAPLPESGVSGPEEATR